MIFTRLAWLLGLALLAFLIWLALAGFPQVTPVLITAFTLFGLIAGGNLLRGRSSAPPRRPPEGDPQQ